MKESTMKRNRPHRMALTLALCLPFAYGLPASAADQTATEPVVTEQQTPAAAPAHSAHDHARMMREMSDLPAAAPALLPGESIYQLDAELTDQNGRAFAFSDGAGQVRLISMFYASCKYVCPMIIDQIRRIEASVDESRRADLGVLMVTLDAGHDTPAVLKELAVSRHVDRANWTLARPRPDDVRPLSALLGIQYRELPDGEFNHSSVISLVAADGRILARTEQLGAKPEQAFLDAVRQALESNSSP